MIHGFVEGFILFVFKKVAKHITIICIARHHDGLFQIDRRLVLMAAKLVSSEVVTHAARILSIWGNDSLFQSDQSVDQFEHRARRIWSLHRTVEHRFIGVGRNLTVVPSDISKHFHIDTRAGYHGQNFSCGRFDGHETAYLIVHKFLTVVLEVGVDRGCDVFAGNGLLVL